MRTVNLHRYLAALLLLLPGFGVGVLGLVSAQEPKARPQSAEEIEPPPSVGQQDLQICPSDQVLNDHLYSGWQNCDFCHGRSDDRPADEDLRQDVLVSSLNEANLWRREDKHALAARVLYPNEAEQNLAFHMQQALGQTRYAELVNNACQACHVAGEPNSPNAAAESIGGLKLKHDFGVTCEGCHGPAKEWVHAHWEERKTWRYKTPEEKTATGFINLRDPVVKARKCLSCHLGSIPEGKIVTHEMYAAGHPPLAGFDAATYSLAMPRHWTPLSERGGEKFDQYKELHGASRIYAANTREVLLGGLAALESNLKLIADYAASPADKADTAGWPEFALYDCFACHHNLQGQSLLVRSRGGGKPGRPPLRSWPNVVAELALAQSESSASLAAMLADVSTALDAQPFAERARISASADAASMLVCQQIERLQRSLDRSALADDQDARDTERRLVDQVLRQICGVAAGKLHDYDTARQLVWAFERVYEDYRKLRPEFARHAAIQQALGELKDPNLGFDLIRGQQQVGEPGTLAAILNARGRYNAERFRDQFRRIGELFLNPESN